MIYIAVLIGLALFYIHAGCLFGILLLYKSGVHFLPAGKLQVY